jgi:hypothetical protein
MAPGRLEMGQDLKSLQNKLKELDEQIEEVKKRLPAHSVKPPIMMELLDLEDARDAVLNQLDALKQSRDR